ncbi:MAG: UDP-N-acetylmuramate--L-alanine ligase [Pseudomonadota bacterium]
MRPAPSTIGTIHLVGIGGIGMSGIAEMLKSLGYDVQGSDISKSANVRRLQEQGIHVFIGHDEANVREARVVVISTAVKADNPEVIAARAAGIPVVRRAEMLAELMRLKSCIAVAGTHGKTTTTSLVAALLDAGNFDATVINGGIINAYGSNARHGDGEWMVVEADESDGTFGKLPSTIAIVTNIDPEHLDFYGSFDAVKAAFSSFVQNIPFYGLAILCTDHPVVQTMVGQLQDRRVMTYGLNPQADIRAEIVEMGASGAKFHIHRSGQAGGGTLENVQITLPGEHNVLNALAAVAAAIELGLSDEEIRAGLQGFAGVKRRFTKVGEAAGRIFIDDYGHHPTEIKAALAAARDASKAGVIAVVQPHRYSRLNDLFDDFSLAFNDADAVFITPVFEAGETPIEGVNANALAQRAQANGHRSAEAVEDQQALIERLAAVSQPDDMIVFLGAGDITRWAADAPAVFQALEAQA